MGPLDLVPTEPSPELRDQRQGAPGASAAAPASPTGSGILYQSGLGEVG